MIYKKEIIAFASTDGGEIFVGVGKNGTVIGANNSENVMEQIGNMIRDGIKPDLTAYTSIEAISEGDKKIIRVAIEYVDNNGVNIRERCADGKKAFIIFNTANEIKNISLPTNDKYIDSYGGKISGDSIEIEPLDMAVVVFTIGEDN